MVEREVSLSLDELVELPLVERHVTIACVSN
jgi:DMSO/TMAO reductase YedYZ molybdopterin-dependent catalytic subunit